MNWFALPPVNGERGGDDSVTVRERKQEKGEGEVMSDDAPFQMGLVTAFSCSGFFPRK